MGESPISQLEVERMMYQLHQVEPYVLRNVKYDRCKCCNSLMSPGGQAAHIHGLMIDQRLFNR